MASGDGSCLRCARRLETPADGTLCVRAEGEEAAAAVEALAETIAALRE